MTLEIYVAVSVIALLLASLTIWSRRDYKVKWVALVLAAIVLFGAKPTLDLMLGLPKPILTEWEYRNAELATVVGMYIAQRDKKKYLYLYLVVPNSSIPRSYVLPWNKKTKKLAGMIAERVKKGKKVQIKRPFRHNPHDDTEEYKLHRPIPKIIRPKMQNVAPPFIF